MSFDLTNKNISDTYQNLLQKTGSDGRLYDLKGNQVRDLTIDGTLTANTYVTSESIVNTSSGSTAFGNSSDDSHKFNGDITASGNISSSGDLFAYSASFNYITASHIDTDGDSISIGGESFTKANLQTLKLGRSLKSVRLGRSKPDIDADDGNFDGNISVTHITASGNISSSGGTITSENMRTNEIVGTDVSLNLNTAGNLGITVGNNKKLFFNEGANINTSFTMQDENEDTTFTVNSDTGNITASGNISASGIFYGNGSGLTNVPVDIDSFGSFVGTVDGADNILISDSGVEKKITVALLKGGLDLSGTNTGDQDLSSLALKTSISGSFVQPSSSFSTRVTSLESNPVFSAAGISGSFTNVSSSFSTRTTTLESNPVFSAAGISGSFTLPSSSFSTRVSTLEGNVGQAVNTNSDVTFNSINVTHFTSSFVTSSTIVTEGSNIFGDTITDTHKFNGHITASGNISSSGNNHTIGDVLIDGTAGQIKYKNIATIQRSGTSNGDLLIGNLDDEAQDKLALYVGGNFGGEAITITGSNGYVGINDETPTDARLAVGGNMRVDSHITASGNISASGNGSFTGTLRADGNVDFNGDLDVDGTTNLDAVDIDGNIDAAGSITMASNQFLYFDEDEICAWRAYNSPGGRIMMNRIGGVGGLMSMSGSAGDAYVGINTGTRGNHANIGLTINGMLSSSAQIHSLSHITASGHISSSDNIYATQYSVDGMPFISYNSGYRFAFTNDNPIQVGKSNNPIHLIGNVTASGNISASGTITASAFKGDGSGLTNISSGTTHLDVKHFAYYISSTGNGDTRYLMPLNSLSENTTGNPFNKFFAPYEGTFKKVIVNARDNNPGNTTVEFVTGSANQTGDVVQSITIPSLVDDTSYEFNFSSSCKVQKGDWYSVAVQGTNEVTNYWHGTWALEYDTST